MAIESQSRLGPYEILGSLGSGGMGEVYRARDTRLDREVAVKVLPGHLADNPSVQQRFEREAKAISGLSHPHICTLHDIGRHEGVDYLVMELLEGETLDERLQRGGLPLDEILKIGGEVADALEAAHRSGVVHRDLKPSNIMLTRTGTKLLDFGLAKTAAAGTSPTDLTATPTVTSPLTAQGTIVGTYQYMAPEQLEGKEADARTDIFAFGSVVYEMAAGKKAFDGQTQASVIGRILEGEPPPLSSVLPSAPPALERLVQTCLAKDPDQRWQSATDLKRELKWIREGGPDVGSLPRTGRGRETMAWSFAALFLAATLSLGGWQLLSGSPETHVVRSQIPPPEGTRFDLSGSRPGPAVLSPDGTRAAFVARDASGNRRLYVRTLDTLKAMPLQETDGAWYPFWAPDSQMLGFFAEGQLKKVDVNRGTPLALCDATNGKGGTWSEDGIILFTPAHNTPLHRVAAAGGEPVTITELDAEKKENSHRFPWFLPDGKHYLYLVRVSVTGLSEDHEIRLGSLDGNGERVLLRASSNAVYASGHLLFMRQGKLMVQPFDTGGLELTGEAFPLIEKVEHIGAASRGVFSASEVGTLIYQPAQDEVGGEMVWMDREGKEMGRLGEPDGFTGDIALSPDGKFVAAAIRDQRIGTDDIWIYDLEKNTRTRFTFDPADDDSPVWSPDGTQLVFSSMREGSYDLYIKSFTGSEEERPLNTSDVDKWASQWTRDGSLLYEKDGNIWLQPMNPAGEGEPRPVIENPDYQSDGHLSPDGKWLVYTGFESGRLEVFATSFPETGRRWQVSTDGGDYGIWRQDGKEIVYGSFGGMNYVVAVEVRGSSLSMGQRRELFSVRNQVGGDVSPDLQKFLLIVRPEGEKIAPLILVQNWPAELTP